MDFGSSARLAAWVRKFIPEEEFRGFIPWTPLAKPLSQATLALVTSAGISLKTDPPFDMEREKKEAIWGDRSYRAIPRGTTEKDIEVNHLHINTNYIKRDINVILPLARMEEFERRKSLAVSPHLLFLLRISMAEYGFLKGSDRTYFEEDET